MSAAADGIAGESLVEQTLLLPRLYGKATTQ